MIGSLREKCAGACVRVTVCARVGEYPDRETVCDALCVSFSCDSFRDGKGWMDGFTHQTHVMESGSW